MDLWIKPHGKAYVVEDSAGGRHSEPVTFEAASVLKEGLEAAERARAANDPAVQMRRLDQAAYRSVDADPMLQMLKQFLPRKGEIERNTQRSHEGSLAFIGAHMSITSSDPQVHAELNKSPQQRKTTKATRQRRQQGAVTREQIAEKWNALSDVPKHKRAGLVAAEMNIDPRHVRRLLK